MNSAANERAVDESVPMREGPEFSIVMPCLNESETLEICIRKAQHSLHSLGVRGEILVADNGSSDGSQAIARRMNARLIAITDKGYGNALRGGIQAAAGKYIIMGDSDDSYDFANLSLFIQLLRDGADLVMGNRFQGRIVPGAMPWHHRWVGNPVLTAIGRILFLSKVGDFHCGLRGFSKEAFRRMDLRTTGMEYASEMVIKSALLKLRIEEVPVVLHKDGRSRPPHLRSFRDGWRHLRFMLLFCPLWLFLIPGFSMMALGLAGGLPLLAGPVSVGKVIFDLHSLLVLALLCIVGFQIVTFGIFTKTFAITQGLHPPYSWLTSLWKTVTLEWGLLAGVGLLLGGGAYLLHAIDLWRRVSFGPLNLHSTMRQVIPAVTLLMLGVQTIFGSFFLSVLGLAQRPGQVGEAGGNPAFSRDVPLVGDPPATFLGGGEE